MLTWAEREDPRVVVGFIIIWGNL